MIYAFGPSRGRGGFSIIMKNSCSLACVRLSAESLLCDKTVPHRERVRRHFQKSDTDAATNNLNQGGFVMNIWVDADACPVAIKEILYRVAVRTKIPLTLVANQMLRVPPSPWIKALQVPSGFDVADQRIVQEAVAGDVVVTADVPLAALVVAKGAVVIDPRGELVDYSNIQERLSMRNFMESLRSSGVETGGPAALSASDRQAFANQLDRLLARRRSAP